MGMLERGGDVMSAVPATENSRIPSARFLVDVIANDLCHQRSELLVGAHVRELMPTSWWSRPTSRGRELKSSRVDQSTRKVLPCLIVQRHYPMQQFRDVLEHRLAQASKET